MNVIGISGLHNSVPFKKKEFPDLSPRAYRIAQGFDSAAALVTRQGVRAAAAEERFSREKATGAFPIGAIQYCLQAARLTPGAVDYVAHGFSYAPFRAYFQHSDFVRKQFAELYSPETQLRHLQTHLPGYDWADKFVPVPHHLAHAASAFYLSGFEEALILIADAMGEIHSTTLAVGRQNKLEIVKQVLAPHSLGILYGVLTLYLGFYMGLDEYKVMGLAPYGNPRTYFNDFMELIKLKPDGAFIIPLLAQNKTRLEKETYSQSLQILADRFGPPRQPGSELTQRHMDLAAALQAALQACLTHILRHFKKETGQSNLCLAGGVALNCTANGMIKRSRMFKEIFIQPAAGDDGSALGAALYVQRSHAPELPPAKMALPLWGPEFAGDAIEPLLKGRSDCRYVHFESFAELAAEIADRIERGQVAAWFQGRMEFGPRALGNRSILADPRDPGMRDHLNHLVKQREDFRPFAPAVTAEAASRFFEITPGDEALYAYMLFVTQVRAAYRQQLPAVTHLDGSARVQVVARTENPKFWTLLHTFGEKTGLPILLNTSFNLRGQPIICTPTEALDTFLASEIDILVIEDYLISRRD